MPAFKSLASQRFGRLVALSVSLRARRNPARHTHWLCICDCGQQKSIAQSSLVHGLTRSCGCLLEESTASVRLPDGLGSMRKRLAVYRRSATYRHLEWALTEVECKCLFLADCYYCGTQPSNFSGPTTGSKSGGFTYNGIDRLDNATGYVAGNVVSCCYICNRAKNCMSYEEFRAWISRCAAHSSNAPVKVLLPSRGGASETGASPAFLPI